MNIQHRPLFDTDKIAEHYSKKDGVAVKYVCTSAIGGEAKALDIFYRATPHPQFGNRYFGLFNNGEHMMITNADKIEEAEFTVMEVDDAWHYSQHRHDYYTVGDVSLDGGRAYFRCSGNVHRPTKNLKVKDGEFVEQESN